MAIELLEVASLSERMASSLFKLAEKQDDATIFDECSDVMEWCDQMRNLVRRSPSCGVFSTLFDSIKDALACAYDTKCPSDMMTPTVIVHHQE